MQLGLNKQLQTLEINILCCGTYCITCTYYVHIVLQLAFGLTFSGNNLPIMHTNSVYTPSITPKQLSKQSFLLHTALSNESRPGVTFSEKEILAYHGYVKEQ